MDPGHGLLFQPDDALDYGSHDGTYRDHWIHFNGAWVPSLVRSSGLPLATPWAVKDPPAADRLFRDLAREHLRRAPHQAWMETSLLVQVLAALARDIAADRSIPHVAALRDLRAEVHAHMTRPWTIQAMAQQIGLSVPRFSSLYRQAFAASPLDDLLEARIETARSLLTAGVPPAEAAAQVGFNDLSYFYRQFRRRCGMTPGQCR